MKINVSDLKQIIKEEISAYREENKQKPNNINEEKTLSRKLRYISHLNESNQKEKADKLRKELAKELQEYAQKVLK